MVMGWAGVKEDWGPLSHMLARKRCVLILDNRGMGESDLPIKMPIHIETMADDIAFILSKLGIQRINLMGISMGGMIAQALALKIPSKINKLILGCTHHGGTNLIQQSDDVNEVMNLLQNSDARNRYKTKDEWKKAYVAELYKLQFAENWIHQHQATFDQIVATSFKYVRPFRGTFGQLGGILAFNTEKNLHLLKGIPALILHGDEDKMVDFRNGLSLLEKLPGPVTFYKLEGTGHLFWYQKLDESYNNIDSFLTPKKSARL
eukprot:TRINITY_DN1929_c0_g1_i2.p1 TRINITY_DN1929_c0_g1~~TRINITY_DN1929_c0_g1_i2.p1  ORF type:complete len:262 (-),score=38.59 TRINITY_DN1929_c0_g1_i2:25-810(-)